VLGDEIPERLKQHVLLCTAQINPEFLERNNGGFVWIVVAADVEFCDAARFGRGNSLHLIMLRIQGYDSGTRSGETDPQLPF
jgi:hypothetical protein